MRARCGRLRRTPALAQRGGGSSHRPRGSPRRRDPMSTLRSVDRGGRGAGYRVRRGPPAAAVDCPLCACTLTCDHACDTRTGNAYILTFDRSDRSRWCIAPSSSPAGAPTSDVSPRLALCTRHSLTLTALTDRARCPRTQAPITPPHKRRGVRVSPPAWICTTCLSCALTQSIYIICDPHALPRGCIAQARFLDVVVAWGWVVGHTPSDLAHVKTVARTEAKDGPARMLTGEYVLGPGEALP